MTYTSGKRYSILLFVSALLACSLGGLRAQAQQDVTVTGTIDSSSVSLGGWIHLTLQARHPSSTPIAWPALRDSLGPFEIVQADSIAKKDESGGTVTETRSLVVARYEPGTASIPPVAVSYRKPNDTTQFTAQSNPIPVDVRGIQVDTSLAIRDIKPPLSVPLSWQEVALYSGILLVLAAIGYAAWWWWKKQRNKALGIVEEKPAIPPDILALAQLQELETKHVWQKGEVKLFYSEATEIVRRYVEGRYGVMALEMTTDEVLDQLAAFKLSRELMDAIRAFLADADMVKFAKVIPSVQDNERVIPAAAEIVEKTRPVLAPAPAVETIVEAEPAAAQPERKPEGGAHA
jgi:hypothetical protein